MAKRQTLSHENWHPIPPCGSTTGHVAERNGCATPSSCAATTWEPSAFETRAEPISMCRKRSFGTGGRGRLPASAAVCRIPCLILCLAYVERVGQYRAPHASCGVHGRMASVIASPFSSSSPPPHARASPCGQGNVANIPSPCQRVPPGAERREEVPTSHGWSQSRSGRASWRALLYAMSSVKQVDAR